MKIDIFFLPKCIVLWRLIFHFQWCTNIYFVHSMVALYKTLEPIFAGKISILVGSFLFYTRDGIILHGHFDVDCSSGSISTLFNSFKNPVYSFMFYLVEIYLETRVAVALRNIPSMVRKNKWENIQQIAFSNNPVLAKKHLLRDLGGTIQADTFNSFWVWNRQNRNNNWNFRIISLSIFKWQGASH